MTWKVEDTGHVADVSSAKGESLIRFPDSSRLVSRPTNGPSAVRSGALSVARSTYKKMEKSVRA